MSKKEKSLHEKMKNFFGRRDTTPVNFEGLKVEPYIVSLETMKDIGSENNVGHRIKALKDLYEHVTTKLLVENAVEAICMQIEDLLNANQSVETRHIVFQFYCALINGQLDHMYATRSYLFKLILLHNIQEDLIPRLEMLKALTQNGKIITYFEEEIGPFLLTLFPDFVAAGREAELLAFIFSVIKYNAAYLDDDMIESFIKHINKLCSYSKRDEDVQESLSVLDAILLYSHLPKTALHLFICTLCITVNLEKFVAYSWKQMRNLMGTNIGHTVIRYLCVILQDVVHHPDPRIVRGAVYFIGNALWGPNKVQTLTHPPSAIIPSFLKAVDRKDKIVAYEIILALNKLLLEHGDELTHRSLIWDAILEVVGKILLCPEFQSTTPSLSTYTKSLHDFINIAEEKCPEQSYENLYKIIYQSADFRNVQSILKLIAFKEKKLKGYNPNFITDFTELIEKFFKNESRSAIQLETVRFIERVRLKALCYFEEDIIDQIILQQLAHTVSVPDVTVRKEAVQLLISMADTDSPSCFHEILEIIEKVMKLALDTINSNGDKVESCSDIVAAVEGLIHVFKKKLFDSKPGHCIEIFNILVRHLEQQYENPRYEEDLIKTRKMIIEFFLQIRANKRRQIGIVSDNTVKYCLFLLCPEEKRDSEKTGSIASAPSSPLPGPSVCELEYFKAFKTLTTCLKEEKDWGILEMLFRELPFLLRNKCLILCGKPTLNSFSRALCNIVLNKNSGLPTVLKNAPANLKRIDVHCQVFSSATALICYRSYIETYVQRILNLCLQSGLVSRSAKICMEGLTLCLMEMQDCMVKLLPDILLQLSKISATKLVAVPVLEFLSNLIRLPDLYVSFVEDQYMSIFAIALPYTNPFKFNQYTVALAHHVLSMWFLKCRIPFRRDFAKFIAKGLRSNLNIPKQRDGESSSSEKANQAIVALHTELMETGLDLMARFTFGMCTNIPQRCPIAEFLLEKGQKCSWLVGNKIVTITTSGCGTKSFKNGLCELCYTSSHEMNRNVDNDESAFLESSSSDFGAENFTSQRRRHRSAIQRSNTVVSKEILSSANKSKDDLTLHYKRDKHLEYARRRHTSYDPGAGYSNLSLESDVEEREKSNKVNHLCSCWCNSWAEIHIRRPTGSTSWMMRIQNQLLLPSAPEVPLSVLNSLLLPKKIENFEEQTIEECTNSESDLLSLDESDKELSVEGAIEIAPSQKSNPPMRRTNSSPDVNTGWLQSFESDKKYPASEGSVETDNDEITLQESCDRLTESTARKQDKMRPRNLTLDLSSTRTDQSSFLQADLPTEREPLASAPVQNEKRTYKNEVEQSSVSGSFRDRGHTISVMSPSRPTGSENSANVPEVSHRSGMSPSFVFLQLFHNNSFGPATHKPLLLQPTEQNNRALHVLDHIPPYDTHKIGVVYIGPEQANNEVAILSNDFGSARYVDFLQGLGKIVYLADVDPKKTYLGGLETNGEDGELGLIWHDDVMQVVFHVATFMRNKPSDEMRNEKKKHVANDSVMIVYNESGEDFEISTIKGQVTNAWIVIQPEEFDCNIVTVKHRNEDLINMFGHTESYMVSDKSLPVFARQMALHANLASLIINRNKQSSPKFAQVSNWLERLRTIKRLESKVLDDLKKKNENTDIENEANDYDDFTDYV
ncbi:tuberin-like isoform X2 [Argiope bruennichi]|uniref:tuberin-like isoform X2 n=1 Tax=Argiope bruennichi TaxID=94029 RepID=UPI0024957654|nr:tuberin-like isoform X2 [Argiope bruennichi]